MTEFEELPEGCIAAILSRTTPVDACRLSLVSKTFRSAADSDDVWNRFLPSDSNFIASIISQFPYLSNAPTKKYLYLILSDRHRPIIIDNSQKSFQLERKSGKKCYMLAARSLTVVWGDDKRYWNWMAMPDSRFPEVAKLCYVWWLEIRGMIDTLSLSPNTHYAAYLVFKMTDGFGFENTPVELSVGVEGGHSSTKIVCLGRNVEHRPQRRIVEPNERRRPQRRIVEPNERRRPQRRIVEWQHPTMRSDGWLEIEMGEFFNSGLEDAFHMSVIETKCGVVKGNFFLEGIEVRPK